jgi:glycogen operon protein
VTAIELMPVHQFVNDSTLQEKGLSNYWGYNTIAFLAPQNTYASTGQRGQQVQEFKGMVRALHAAGIEVILDVVYNHTAEGNHMGPTLSMRGIDNEAYYRSKRRQAVLHRLHRHRQQHERRQPAHAAADHGLAALLGARDARRRLPVRPRGDPRPRVLRGRQARGVLRNRAAGPGDQPGEAHRRAVGHRPGGYQVGNFPPQWTEWNGKYRDTVRDFWRGEPSTLGEFASRLTGSADLYEHDGRRPVASINFVTAHDGFTLRDLVSYNEKHNDANGEDGNDGESHNRSWNCGVEGPTDDPAS